MLKQRNEYVFQVRGDGPQTAHGDSGAAEGLRQPRQRPVGARDSQVQPVAKGQRILYPQENYYGWLVNARLDELRSLF